MLSMPNLFASKTVPHYYIIPQKRGFVKFWRGFFSARWGRLTAESFVAESLGDGFEGDGLVVQVDPVDSVQAGATNDSATNDSAIK